MAEGILGLDTSIVLRLLTGEPEVEARVAVEFVRASILRGKRLVVSDLVVSEAYFALVAHYGVDKRSAVDGLLEMLERGPVESCDGSCAVEVLSTMKRAGQKPGMVDRLIHAHYASLPAALVSFERASRKLSGALVLGG
jgi:predicted nucleic acid-binding protein